MQRGQRGGGQGAEEQGEQDTADTARFTDEAGQRKQPGDDQFGHRITRPAA